MKTKSLLFALVLLLGACNTAAIEPKFQKVENLVVVDLESNKVTITGDAVVYNPNPISIYLNEIELDILANDAKVGHISQSKKTEIAKKADFSIPLMVSFNPQSLVEENWMGLLESALNAYLNQKIELNFKGHATFEVKGISFKVPISYTEEIVLKE